MFSKTGVCILYFNCICSTQWICKPVLVNLFRNRTHFQLLLKSLYTTVFTTQYTEIASMLTEKNKTPVKKNIYLFQ